MNAWNVYLIHSSHQVVDFVFSVTVITSFNEVVGDLLESTLWCGQFQWPQEGSGLFEVGSNSEDLVDQIFHADDTLLAQSSFDDGVVRKWSSSALNTSMTTFVDQFLDSFQVRITPCDHWFGHSEHLKSSFVQLDKDSIVDLSKTEELQNLAHFRAHLVDTSDTDNQG